MTDLKSLVQNYISTHTCSCGSHSFVFYAQPGYAPENPGDVYSLCNDCKRTDAVKVTFLLR
jgi:hypothetical protein